MKRKISAVAIIFVLIISIFTCCKSEGEPAIQLSDNDSVNIKEDLSHIDSQVDTALSAKATATPDNFQKVLENSDTSAASYNGAEDITIALPEYSSKTVAIKTAGTLSLDSAVYSLVIIDAAEGFTANAKADSIIIKGENITADINSETGCIYIEGKNAQINIMNSSIEKIIARNTTAVINNIADEEIFVTLTNGTKVKVPANNTYVVKDNIIQKYKPTK